MTADDPINDRKVTTTTTSVTKATTAAATVATMATATGDGKEVDDKEKDGGNEC